MDEPIQPRSFKLAAMYRRSLCYTGGSLVPLGIALTMIGPVQADGRVFALHVSVLGVAITSSIAIAVCLWANHWQIRVDEQGVHRRRLFRWSSWTWDDFRSGAIIPGKFRGVYKQLGKRLGTRTLRVDFLEPADGEFLASLCNRYCAPAPHPELPADMTLAYPKIGFNRTKIHFSRHGMDFQKGSTYRSYVWPDVQSVEVVKVSRLHRDFRLLTAQLPDREITLSVIMNQGDLVQTWRGPKADVVAAFFEAHVSEDRIRIKIPAHGILTAEDAKAEIKTHDGAVAYAKVAVCFVCLWFGFQLARVAWKVRSRSLFEYLILACTVCLLLSPLALLLWWMWGARKRAQQKRRELEDLLLKLQSEKDEEAPASG